MSRNPFERDDEEISPVEGVEAEITAEISERILEYREDPEAVKRDLQQKYPELAEEIAASVDQEIMFLEQRRQDREPIHDESPRDRLGREVRRAFEPPRQTKPEPPQLLSPARRKALSELSELFRNLPVEHIRKVVAFARKKRKKKKG